MFPSPLNSVLPPTLYSQPPSNNGYCYNNNQCQAGEQCLNNVCSKLSVIPVQQYSQNQQYPQNSQQLSQNNQRQNLQNPNSNYQSYASYQGQQNTQRRPTYQIPQRRSSGYYP